MSGERISECAKCHEVFTSLGNFDKHQKIAYDTPTPVTCVDPESVGLIMNKHGQWTTPYTGDKWWETTGNKGK